MQVSATVLGREFGLTGEEMNRVLVKLGFLEGASGAYSVTSKAMQYAVETDHHRGTGGYDWYNRYWTTRTFDDSIKNVLNVPDDLINEVRNELAAARAERYAKLVAERAQASAEFLAKQAAKKATEEAEALAMLEWEEFKETWKKVGKAGAIFAGVVIIGYGLKKGTPQIKAWWEKRKGGKSNECDACDKREPSEINDVQKAKL